MFSLSGFITCGIWIDFCWALGFEIRQNVECVYRGKFHDFHQDLSLPINFLAEMSIICSDKLAFKSSNFQGIFDLVKMTLSHSCGLNVKNLFSTPYSALLFQNFFIYLYNQSSHTILVDDLRSSLIWQLVRKRKTGFEITRVLFGEQVKK